MRKLLCVFLGSVFFQGCAATVPKPDAKDHWVNVADGQNKIVAAVNTKDGKIVYYADPKEAFVALLSAYQNLVGEVQKRAAEINTKDLKKEPKK